MHIDQHLDQIRPEPLAPLETEAPNRIRIRRAVLVGYFQRETETIETVRDLIGRLVHAPQRALFAHRGGVADFLLHVGVRS